MIFVDNYDEQGANRQKIYNQIFFYLLGQSITAFAVLAMTVMFWSSNRTRESLLKREEIERLERKGIIDQLLDPGKTEGEVIRKKRRKTMLYQLNRISTRPYVMLIFLIFGLCYGEYFAFNLTVGRFLLELGYSEVS